MKNIFKFWNTKNILSNIKACVPIMPIAAVGILILILSGCGNKARPDIDIQAIPSPSGWTNDKVDVTFKRMLTDAQCETELNKYYSEGCDPSYDSCIKPNYHYLYYCPECKNGPCYKKKCSKDEYSDGKERDKQKYCPSAGRHVDTVYGITSNGKRTKKGTFNGYKYKLPYVVGNIDTIKPTLSVTNSSSGWKKSPIDIKIESKDARGNGYYDLDNKYHKVASGLKYVKYSWDGENKYSKSLYTYHHGYWKWIGYYPKWISGNYTEDFSDTIKLDKEGVHTLYVKVMDNATGGDGVGNPNTASRTYKLDKTKPSIKDFIITEKAKAGDDNFTFSFKLFDNLNGETNKTNTYDEKVHYKFTINTSPAIIKQGYIQKNELGKNKIFTETIHKANSKGGYYTISYELTDKAGNKTTGSNNFVIYPADLNQTNPSISVSSNGDKYANASDKYTYIITLKDKYNNPIYDKKITNLLSQDTKLHLDEVHENNGSALIYPTSNIGPSDPNGKISFDLKSYTPGDFDQKFKITMKKWDDDYTNNSYTQNVTKKTSTLTNSFKKPISGKIDTATSPLTGTDVGEPQIGKNITYNFVLTNSGNAIFSEGKVDLGNNGEKIKLAKSGHYWKSFNNHTNNGDYTSNTNDLSQQFSGLIDATSDFLDSPQLTTSGAIISYKLAGKYPIYYLKDMPSSYGSSCSPTTLGVKIVGNIQGDGKLATIRGGDGQNISDLSKASLRGKIRANAYKAIRHRENTKGETVNGIYYNTGNIKYSNIKSMLNKNNTVIIENGNFVIDEDIPSDKMIGIIVLKERYKVTYDFNNKGNVYVTSNVEKINAVIYADGAFRSAYLDTTNGIIKEYTSDYDLKDKLTLNGSLFTRNTIGGATGDSSTYTLPGGQFTDDRNLAQYYDLNYVRKVPLNCSAPESERGVSFIIKYNPQVQVNPPKLFGK